jgi:hypothetical protein
MRQFGNFREAVSVHENLQLPKIDDRLLWVRIYVSFPVNEIKG